MPNSVYVVYHIVTDSFLAAGHGVTVAFYSETDVVYFLQAFLSETSFIAGGPIQDYTFNGLSRDRLGSVIESEFLVLPRDYASLQEVLMLVVYK